MVRIAVLVSGGGTNLQALIDHQLAGGNPGGSIALVLSTSPTAYALERAKAHGIPTAVVCRRDHPDGPAFDQAIRRELEDRGIDLIVLAGFLAILGEEFTSRYRGRIINVHPSLIPAFCGDGFYGLRVHEAVLSSGVKVTGATVHFVNEVTDGGEILLQQAVEVREGDTPEALQRRVMEEAEWVILPQAVTMLCDRLGGGEAAGHKNPMPAPLAQLLRRNSYPGRGIALGLSEDGASAVAVYFIMGRSQNSRNRVFVTDGAGIRTQAFDPQKLEDPSLVIYAPVRVLPDGRTIVTNGDQTDTVYEVMAAGGGFEEALRTRTFEPDAPNYTPRISGLLDGGEVQLSILKSGDGDPSTVRRFFYEYQNTLPGRGYFIHTYRGDGSSIPSFIGEPHPVALPGDIDHLTRQLWDSLHEENKVSLFVRYQNLVTGAVETRIVNKNQGC